MNAEATRLDHRDLNHDLRVFATDPLAGAGLPLWLPESEADLIRPAPTRRGSSGSAGQGEAVLPPVGRA
jgi:hypothetical protein